MEAAKEGAFAEKRGRKSSYTMKRLTDNNVMTTNRLEEMLKNIGRELATLKTISGMVNPVFVSCSAEDRCWVSSLPVEEWMSNVSGQLHGGLAAVAADYCMGVLARCLSGEPNGVSTTNLQISYLRPVGIGVPLMIEARAHRIGRHLAYMTASGWQEDSQEPCFMATGTFFIHRSER